MQGPLRSHAEAYPQGATPRPVHTALLRLFASLRQKSELGEKGGKTPGFACQTIRGMEGNTPHGSARNASLSTRLVRRQFNLLRGVKELRGPGKADRLERAGFCTPCRGCGLRLSAAMNDWEAVTPPQTGNPTRKSILGSKMRKVETCHDWS